MLYTTNTFLDVDTLQLANLHLTVRWFVTKYATVVELPLAFDPRSFFIQYEFSF